MSGRSKILIIDDDPTVRLRVEDLVAQSPGLELIEATDGADGLAAAKRELPDLILLDVMMPGMTGFEVCREVRASEAVADVPVIVLSALEDSESVVEALDAGADDFLRKPFSGAELRAKIRAITRLDRFRRIARGRDRFRWMVEHAKDPVIVADDQGRLVLANPSARELFGLGAETGEGVAGAIGLHWRPEPADAWSRWRTHAEGEMTFTLFQPESAVHAARWYDVRSQSLDERGTQRVLMFTNRSAALRREVEMCVFQRLISHKIRTPLNGLRPIFDFIEAGATMPFDPETASMLALARESAERLEDTLLSILKYHDAMFTAREGESDDASSLHDLLKSAAERHGLGPHLVEEYTDVAVLRAATLGYVLDEILENYAKFSGARDHGLSVETSTAVDGGLGIRLFAPGPSLPPDLLRQLGAPFVQLEKAFSGEVPGMGLGLATARILVRSLGGELKFSAPAAGSGVVTEITVPARLCRTAGVCR